MHDNAIPFGKTAEEIIWDAVKEYDYPVCMGMPFGHIGMENLALILGRQTTLNIAPNGNVTIKQ
jgi:muramoyltetrapeptide carboxypeptidase